MSNVTGESAEAVSSYMTAIWNNFADGSESLEHYADVITELGAATASSSEEIAEGLQKFASVGETVGLSYDYATTALATVVAETRQSADVVGTAFKTLFARIQDLELGDTLEDGTTLGTYSQALAAIGVNIKDANGEVKDMDDILDEMGEKWQIISKDEQIAVAQAVAGKQKRINYLLIA
jgi:TP901 family phage tail tape measure protein